MAIKDNNYKPDIDRLLKTAKRLEKRADEIPWWKKGTIVFAYNASAASKQKKSYGE